MITRSEDGSGGLLGGTTVALDGAMTSTVQPLVERPKTQDPALTPGSMPVQKEANISDEKFLEEQRKREQQEFEKTAQAIEQAVKSDPQIADMLQSLRIDQTTEGLRIQILEQQDKPLFASGSATLLPDPKKLMRQVSEVIQKHRMRFQFAAIPTVCLMAQGHHTQTGNYRQTVPTHRAAPWKMRVCLPCG